MFIGSFFCNEGLFMADTCNTEDREGRFGRSAQNCYDRTSLGEKGLERTFRFKIVTGIDCCSKQQVLFY